MKRLTLLMVPALVSACGAELRAAVPQPVVAVAVAAPPPDAAVAVDATADVDMAPVLAGDPEEMTATSEPPDPVYEEPTDSPDPTYVWVGGYWGWNGVDWGWNWGRWAAPPEGQLYIAPYYERVGGSVVFVSGYWGPHDAPMRSYGGDRITFEAAVRPAGYVRGQHTVVEHRAGPAPGQRLGGSYEHTTGTARAVPHQTAPQKRVATTNKTTTPRGGKEPSIAHEREGAAGHQTTTGRETTSEHRGATAHEAATGRGTTPEHESAIKVATAEHGAPHEAPTSHAAPAAHPAPATHVAPARSAPAPQAKKK